MQTISDVSTVELTRTRVSLRKGLRFIPQRYGDETFCHIEDPSNSAWFRIGYPEYVFVSLLDGQTSFAQALAIASQTLGEDALARNDALAVYTWLLENGLASFAEGSGPPIVGDQGSQAATQKLLQKMNPFWIRIPIGHPRRLLSLLAPRCQWLFSGPASLLVCALVIAAGIIVRSNWQRFSAASEGVFAPDNWLWLLLAWMGLKIVHELAHAIVCRRYGGEVRQIGIVLAFFVPMAYVDASASWSFRSRWQRIHTALAGIYAELFVAAVAVIAWKLTHSVTAEHLLYNVVLMASVSTLLFNINPLMRFDGYYVLSDLLQIPNLASQASEVLRNSLKRIVFGITVRRPVLVGSQHWILLAYGVLAAGWRILISLTLMIGASVMFHGAGMLLVVPAVIAWFGMPSWQFFRMLLHTWRAHPPRLLRATLVAGATVCLFSLALFAPAPVVATAPAIVDYTDGEVIRATTRGFVEKVHVADGQHVDRGDLLIELRNEEIQNRYFDLELAIQQEIVRRQQASRRHESGAISVANANLRSLRQQLAEAQRDFDGLKIHAKTSGLVIARSLDHLEGTFAAEGKHLLTVGTENNKELHVSVSQQDLESSLQHTGEAVRVRIGTRQQITGILERVNPRATRKLPDDALAATNGGQLAVIRNTDSDQPDNRSQVRLTDERFDATVRLTEQDSARVRSGERAVVSLGLADVSIGNWLFRGTQHWFRDKIELAMRQE